MKKGKLFSIIFFITFLFFIISYTLSLNGYYEYKLQNKTIMTNNEIERFEKDILEGKDVRREDYLVDTYKDYTSKINTTTTNISLKVNKILKNSIEAVFKIASTLVEE